MAHGHELSPGGIPVDRTTVRSWHRRWVAGGPAGPVPLIRTCDVDVVHHIRVAAAALQQGPAGRLGADGCQKSEGCGAEMLSVYGDRPLRLCQVECHYAPC